MRIATSGSSRLIECGSGQRRVLNGNDAILAEMKDYPGPAGEAIWTASPEAAVGTATSCAISRSGAVLLLIASTGFHRSKYYPPDWWLWQARHS